MFRIFVITLVLIITGCSSPSIELYSTSAEVQVFFSHEKQLEKCQWIGQVTGSEGHWYNVLFYGNDVLINGALNELRNNAQNMGGDTLLIAPSLEFATSVTYLGTVFRCHE